MSLWSMLRGLFGGAKGFALVWREQTPDGAIMRGELIREKAEAGALSEVRARFRHQFADLPWAFWCLFRPNDSLVTAEQGPKIKKWAGDFSKVSSDMHVAHTLESLRKHGKPVSRPLHRVKLKDRGGPPKIPGQPKA
jgi:hypothetical protein